ncbi:MAG: AMP-binding protein [Oscillospiraceae bacterium]|jgi:fatty-acyl-CoA synthase|nr:AMP-binding protein [Oscillospiraceae bacterium]
MKISFSTLATPDFSWVDIYSMAKDLNFDGIEIRGIGEEIFAYKAKPFVGVQLKKTIEKLRQLNLQIPCLSSGACLKFEDKHDEIVKEVTEYCKLAQQLGAPYVRVLADDNPQPGNEVDDKKIAEFLCELAQIALPYGVTLLVETNGVYGNSARLKALLDAADCTNIAALWDIHHPYRYFGEAPQTTAENLGSYIKFVHVKDSVMQNGQPSYRLMGDGDMPLEDIFAQLQKTGYNGYISLEWVKRWAKNLSDAGIVFPQFANYMEPYRSGSNATWQTDDRGTGYYPYPKNTLIDAVFPDVLDKICDEYPNQIAFHYHELDYHRTYAQFRNDVNNFARALIALGVKKGDHVAIWATNVPQWYITFWAATKIGAVLVTVNTAYKIYEAEYLLKQSDTHTLVMIDGHKDSDYAGIMKTLCPELATTDPTTQRLQLKKLPRLRNIINCQSSQPGCLTWEQSLKMGESIDLSEVERMRSKIKPDDVCNMQYTSGTTGFPKGVMLTHRNVVNNGKAIGDCMDISTYDRMMIQVPMFHCFGMVLCMTAAMTHGTSMYPITAFSPRKGLDCINTHKITAFQGVPTMFIAMLNHPDFEKTDFSTCRTGIMAGSPCPIKTMQDVIDKMNMSEICITYGQTESSPACTMSKTTDSIDARVNTVGGAIFGVECKIVDPETYEDLPDDTDGEFVARGYNIMKGYYKMPEATAAAIDDNGWLHTGDVARRGKDGYYKITGRIKDMIIRGGENIYPKEIEDFIYTHPKVRDVQVIGVPDKDYGEEIYAAVIKSDDSLTKDELFDYIRQNMAKHKTPRYIEFVDEFPMNAAGKILKYKMRETAVETLNLQSAAEIETA